MVRGIHHIAIRATNIDETIQFYKQVLNFSIRHEWSLPQFNLERAVMLKSADGNTFIEIFDKDADIPAQGRVKNNNEDIVQGALLHLAFTVDNVESTYKRALEGGATCYIEPSIVDLGGNPRILVKNALVYTPNGEVIEFLEKNDL